ncbi:MAG: nuclease-related domain-containing protein [Chloroflexota bacterium]
MTNSFPLIIIVILSLVVLIAFAAGFFVGYAIKNHFRYRIRVNQNRGEAAVFKVIKSNFSPPQFHLLNNITIPFRDGTTQIDHVLVSTKGIFVIETKNYSGWLFADEKSKQWAQVFYGVTHKFQNPIHQNYLHVKALEQLFDFLPKEQIHSVVVFTGSAQFKTPMPKGVYYLHQLVEFLNSFQNDVISPNRVEFCVGRLECKRYEVTKMTDIQHRAYLARKFGKSMG